VPTGIRRGPGPGPGPGNGPIGAWIVRSGLAVRKREESFQVRHEYWGRHPGQAAVTGIQIGEANY
jgi:hypothetical protein